MFSSRNARELSIEKELDIEMFLFLGDHDKRSNLWKIPFLSSRRSPYTRLALHCHGNDVTVSHLHIAPHLPPPEHTSKKEHGSV